MNDNHAATLLATEAEDLCPKHDLHLRAKTDLFRLGIRFFSALIFRLKMPVGHCIECDKAINRGANLTEYKVSASPFQVFLDAAISRNFPPTDPIKKSPLECQGFTYHTNCFVCQICAKNITGPQGKFSMSILKRMQLAFF